VSKADLRLDWCDAKAARYAVEHWHYSRTMPVNKTVRIGVWERGEFIGCVLFSEGNTPNLGKAYGVTQFDVCELVRVALRRHESPVSRIVAIAIRLLREACPGLRLIVSFADPAHGHHGGIYQAGGWIFNGDSPDATQWLHKGEWKHNRTMTSGWGEKRVLADLSSLPRRTTPGKHRYLFPLDEAMRQQIAPLARPYPKRAPEASQDVPANQAGEGGAAPTPALDEVTSCG